MNTTAPTIIDGETSIFSDESKTFSKPKLKINENEMKTILDETSSAGCTSNNKRVPHDHFCQNCQRERKMYFIYAHFLNDYGAMRM